MSRLRRAPLFIPGDSQRKIEKGLGLDADSIILELEDGVAYNRKKEARQIVTQVLQDMDFGRSERLVRINAFDSGLAESDLTATLIGQPDGYVIPKVESGAIIKAISQKISQFETEHNWPPGQIKLLAIVETALGVMNLRDIATADPRLEALMFGAEDLAGDIGAIRTGPGWEVFYAKSAVVTTAAAFGLEAIDTPYIHLKNPEGLAVEAQQAAELGYSGKMAIHPAQLTPLHTIFTPSPEAIAAAKRLLDAHEAHQASGSGVFTLDNKMVDMPMVRAAQKIIEKVKTIHDKNQ